MPFELRPIEAADLGAIDALYHPYSGRHINVPRVSEAILSYPSVLAAEGSEVGGFAYCFRFAPDILELANIYIRADARRTGLGSRMLEFLRSRLAADAAAIIAVNSDLYPVREDKERPDGFYLRNGFQILASTPASTVYWWERFS